MSPSPPHAHVLAISGPTMDSPGLTEFGRQVGASERTFSRMFRYEVGIGYTVPLERHPAGEPLQRSASQRSPG